MSSKRLTKKLFNDKATQLYTSPKSNVRFSRKELLYKELVKLLNKQNYEYSEKLVKSWLSEWYKLQNPDTLHKPTRRKFKRLPVVVKGVGEQLQMDLLDLHNFAEDNEMMFKMPGKSRASKTLMKYILVIIDVFSKKAWAYPLPNKEGGVLKMVLTKFLERYKKEEKQTNGGRTFPRKIQTDKGSEFLNSEVQNLFKKTGIDYFQTDNPETKASIVERFNRTLMSYINKYYTYEYQKLKEKDEKKQKRKKDGEGGDWRVPNRWVDVLDDTVENYNNRYHRSIDRAPNEVNYENEIDVIAFMNSQACTEKSKQILDEKKPKSAPFKVGEKVLINIYASKFRKGYTKQWRDEVYEIVERIYENGKYMFKLRDLDGEPLRGRFYHYELQKVPSKIFLSGKEWKPTSYNTL